MPFGFSDGKISVSYVLAALGVIPDVPELKNVPEFDTLINIDSQFINSFIRGKGALADVEHFSIQPADGGVEFVIGFSDINSNRISIKVQSGAVKLTEPIVFNANLFKEVLNANKECSGLSSSSKFSGSAHIEFKIDDFSVKYYLVSREYSMSSHGLWVMCYRPSTLDTYVGNETLKTKVERFIEDKMFHTYYCMVEPVGVKLPLPRLS